MLSGISIGSPKKTSQSDSFWYVCSARDHKPISIDPKTYVTCHKSPKRITDMADLTSTPYAKVAGRAGAVVVLFRISSIGRCLGSVSLAQQRRLHLVLAIGKPL